MRLSCVCLAFGTALSTGAMAQGLLLDPIVVDNAARDERALLDTPMTVTVVGGARLERRMATTAGDPLRDVPGVLIEGGPRGIAQEPNIRGFRDDQVVLRFDGGRFNFDQAHRGRFFVDPEIVERIEVIRGGGSTLHGSGAMGGVIAVETRDAADLLLPGQDIGGRLSFGYDDNGEVAKTGATLYGRQGNFDAMAFLGWRGMGADLDDGDGDDIRNSQIDVLNGMVKFGWEPDAAQRFEFSASRYQDDGTTPADAGAVSTPDTDVDRDAEVSTFRLSWDYAPEGSDAVDLSVLFYGNWLDIEEDRDADGRKDETSYDTLGFEVVNRSYFDIGRPVTLVYGVEALRDTQEGRRDGEKKPQFPDAEATTVSAFAEATIALTDRLELTPGLRFDAYRRNPDADGLDDVDDEFLSPRLGISFRPNDNWQVYGNVARAFRAPSLTELYNDGVHFATGSFPMGPGLMNSGINNFVPNPDLEPEKSTQFEIGARYEGFGVMQPGDRLNLSVNAYYADVEDYIDQVVAIVDFDTITVGPGGAVVGGTTRTDNVDATLWGFEAGLDYDAERWFAGLDLSLPRGEGEDNRDLGSLPQDRLTLTAGFRPTDVWELGARATFAAERDDDLPAETRPSDGYTTLDLFASWRPEIPALRGTVFRAGVDNVFDKTYNIYPNELNEAGRRFKLSASVRF